MTELEQKASEIMGIIGAVLVVLIVLLGFIYCLWYLYTSNKKEHEYLKNCSDEELLIITKYKENTKVYPRRKKKQK